MSNINGMVTHPWRTMADRPGCFLLRTYGAQKDGGRRCSVYVTPGPGGTEFIGDGTSPGWGDGHG